MKLNNKDVKKPLKGMTIGWLADECQIPISLLCKLARDTRIMYWPTRKEPKKGRNGYREIDPPKREYKKILRKISKVISLNIKHHPAAHGGVPKRSSFTSARQHCGAKYVITRDIKNCYPTITTKQLFKAFKKLGATHEFAKFLSLIMTVHGRIPQGGPTSCLALNFFMLRMDDHFDIGTKAKGGHYSRLSDDFIISNDIREKGLRLEKELDHAIRHRNLQINEIKLRKKGFLDGECRKEVHSLIINSKCGLKPKKEHRDKGLKLAKRYARYCRCAKPEDLVFLAKLREKAYGMMYYLRQADFSPARHIRRMLERGDAKVLIMLKRKGLQPYKNKWWLHHKSRNEPQRLLRLWHLKQHPLRVA